MTEEYVETGIALCTPRLKVSLKTVAAEAQLRAATGATPIDGAGDL